MLPSKLHDSLAVRKLNASAFVRSRDHLPTSRGFGDYRALHLPKLLHGPFNPLALPEGYGRWLDERAVEYPWLFSLLPEGPGALLDAGSTLNHEFVLRHPKLREKNLTIMTLAPEKECHWRKGISYIYGDLRHTILREAAFDLVVSLSVIEHIGLDNRIYTGNGSSKATDASGYLAAVAEFRRMLKPGGECYISVPFGKRDVRSWLQVFDGDTLDRMIESFAPQSHTEHIFLYNDRQEWTSATRQQAANALYFDVHHDKPWPGCPAAAGAVACVRLRKAGA